MTVVADAVDGYNPLHDLTSAIGRAVASRLAGAGSAVSHLVCRCPFRALRESMRRKCRSTPKLASASWPHFAFMFPSLKKRSASSRMHRDVLGSEVLMEQDFDRPQEFEPQWEKFAQGACRGRPICPSDHLPRPCLADCALNPELARQLGSVKPYHPPIAGPALARSRANPHDLLYTHGH